MISGSSTSSIPQGTACTLLELTARIVGSLGRLLALGICLACFSLFTSWNVAKAAESDPNVEAEITEAGAVATAEAQPASIQYPLTSCEGTYDSKGNVTAAGLRLIVPSGLHHSSADSTSKMDVWAAGDGLSYLYLYTEDYGEIVTRDNVETTFGPHYDAMIPEVAEKMGAEVVSQGLVVNDYGKMMYAARLIGRNLGGTRVDLDIFLISIPAPETVLLVVYTAPNGVYDLRPAVDAIVQTIAHEGTAVETVVEGHALSRRTRRGGRPRLDDDDRRYDSEFLVVMGRAQGGTGRPTSIPTVRPTRW